jgi:hypothetical protein
VPAQPRYAFPLISDDLCLPEPTRFDNPGTALEKAKDILYRSTDFAFMLAWRRRHEKGVRRTLWIALTQRSFICFTTKKSEDAQRCSCLAFSWTSWSKVLLYAFSCVKTDPQRSLSLAPPISPSRCSSHVSKMYGHRLAIQRLCYWGHAILMKWVIAAYLAVLFEWHWSGIPSGPDQRVDIPDWFYLKFR